MNATRLRALVADVDVTAQIPPITPAEASRAAQAWVLVRAFTEPLGSIIIDLPAGGLSARGTSADGLTASELAQAIDDRLGPKIRARVSAAGGDLPDRLPVTGVTVPTTPAYLARRQEVLRSAPSITVVVCTRNRAQWLGPCLESLLAQQYPRFRVLVVDNAPRDDSTRHIVRAAAQRGPVDYVVQPKPGLSRARNTAARLAPDQTLAYVDDDAIADPHWLAEVARALADVPPAAAVAGTIIPAELATDAQMWFEQYGGHSKGRGFTRAVFSPANADLQSPLYPLPPFGAGGNMVFRPGAIEQFGFFDEALGAGTPAMGSEDTLAFMRILHRGGIVVYQPSALVRHHSRREVSGLQRQTLGYGMGLTAAYTGLVLNDPRTLFPLLRLAPTALRDVLSPSSRRVAGIRADFPPELLRELLRENRRGMLRGPWAYLRGRAAVRSSRKASR